jgi:DNA-directed RNA polymerase specialized sigma24 family protein
MLHPVFTDILNQHFGAITTHINKHINAPVQTNGKQEDNMMTRNEIARIEEAYENALLARKEAEDEIRLDAIEQAESDITFNDLLQALASLPEEQKEEVLRQATLAEPTELLTEIFDRLKHARVEKILQQPVNYDDFDFGGEAA